MIAVFLISWSYYTRKRDREKAKQREQFLRSQIIQHFLGNAMASIMSYVPEGRANDLLKRYDGFIRSRLELTATTLITVAQEADALRTYLELERCLSEEKFDYGLNVGVGLDAERTLIEPMLVQPWVENAIKHGIKPMTGSGRIDITLKLEGSDMVFLIRDNGVGITKTPKPPQHLSWGTRITDERLKIKRKLGGKAGTFQYIPVPQGTLCEIRIPVARAPRTAVH